MSTSSNVMLTQEPFVSTVFQRAGKALKTCWVAYINWRLEQFAIARLRSMSDRELKDIGVSRATIEFAVKGTPDRQPMSTYY